MKLYEKEIVSIDGTNYLMRIAPYKTDDLQVKGVVLVFIDVSSLKKTEHKLLDTKNELQLMTKQTSDIVVRYGVDGKIKYSNESFKEFFATNNSNAENSSIFYDYLPPEMTKKIKSNIKRWNSQNNSKDKSFMFDLELDSGKKQKISWHTKAKFDASGSVRLLVTIGLRVN